jgi:hypothetical protein
MVDNITNRNKKNQSSGEPQEAIIDKESRNLYSNFLI